MQPDYISNAMLLGVQQRYAVPPFQHPYVWSKAEQAGIALALTARDLEAV